MTRSSAAAVRDDLEDQESVHALLGFLTITHAKLDQPIRVVSDVFDYVLDGNTFVGLPFEIELLNDTDAAPETRLRVQNTDRRIGIALREVTERARVQLQVISSADFDLSLDPREPVGTPSAIYGYAHFELIDVEVNAVEITGRIFLRDYAQEPCGLSATQSRCPGLFR